MKYPKTLQILIDKLSLLPAVGPKTAERYAFYLLKQKEDDLKGLADTISNLKASIKTCRNCLAISESDPCSICSDDKRDNQILCVVENIQDMIVIEKTEQYQGKYFILGGLISMVDEIGPEKLSIKKLVEVINKNKVKELIIALNFTLEGETTSMYLNKLFKDKIKLTRLAKGLPAGSDLEYADHTTLKSALKYRSELK
jgi:recombination protein RecR